MANRLSPNAVNRIINFQRTQPIRFQQAGEHIKFARLRNGILEDSDEADILRLIEGPSGQHWRRPVQQQHKRYHGGDDYGKRSTKDPVMADEDEERAMVLLNRMTRRFYDFVSYELLFGMFHGTCIHQSSR